MEKFIYESLEAYLEYLSSLENKKMGAVESLQSKIGVAVDGGFGPKTLKAAKNYFKLNDYQAAHFFAQCAHESGNFKIFVENLNYSEKGLLETFPKYFNSTNVKNYARQPQKIANRTYANRYGNGNEASGDGWKFRGRGSIQLTFRDNYSAFADYVKDKTVLSNPDQVADKYAFDSAFWYFDYKKIWSVCNEGVSDTVIKKVTKLVNGGQNGIEDRIKLTKKFYQWLAT
jgi:putative chitinase